MKKHFFAALAILLFVIVFVSCNSHKARNKNDTKDVFNEVWSFTMKYGEDNLGYSIESQVNFLVQIMRSQGYTCYVSNKLVSPISNDIYNVSLSIVCPDTNEELEYAWITNMNHKTVAPNNDHAKQFVYP